jgi:hypothetical protein
MSNYALNWLRTSLIFAAISITSLIPHPLDAKGMGLEPPWAEWSALETILGLTGGTAGGAFVAIDHVTANAKRTQDTVIALFAILTVFGIMVAVVLFIVRIITKRVRLIKPSNGKPIRRKSSVTDQKASPTLPNPG